MSTSESIRPSFLTLWDFGDPAGTEQRFKDLRDSMEPAADRSTYAQLLSQIARCQGLRRDYAAAHATLDEAEALIAGHELPAARLRCRLERGRAFASPAHREAEMRREAARACFLEVFEEGRRLGLHGFSLDAAHMLGIVEPPDEALTWNLRAIALAESSTDEAARGWLGSLYNNTAWSYHERGEYETALALFEKALAWREARGEENQVRIMRWCVARCLRSLGRLDAALSMQQSLMQEYASSGALELGYTSEELAECLLALGREVEARPWFARAHARLSEHEAWLLEAEPERMRRLAELGGLD